MSTNIYGNLCNYQTGEILRPATRQDWLRARKDGEKHTGAHKTEEFGETTIFCDGPETLKEDVACSHCVLVNRTPHEIVVLAPGAGAGSLPLVTIPRAQRGHDARVETTTSKGYTLYLKDGVAVETVHQRWGQIVGLSKPVPGVFQIVSAIVAAAARAAGRTTADLLVPGDQVRDHRGAIVGCRGLAEASDAMPHLAPGAEMWCTYTARELHAFGVPAPVVAIVTGSPGGRLRVLQPELPATAEELEAWMVMRKIYMSHFGDDPAVVKHHNFVTRYDVASLAEALFVRPHRRAIASSADT